MKNSIVPSEFPPGQLPAAAGGPPTPAYYEGDWGGSDSFDADEGAGNQARLRRYWAAIKRFWWLVTGITALGTAAGVIGSRAVRPTYEARGTLLILAVAGNNSPANGPLRAPDLLPIGSWLGLIKSFAVVNRVVAQMHLWYTPKVLADTTLFAGLMPTESTIPGDYTLSIDSTGTQYTLSEFARGVVERGRVGDSVGRNVGFVWLPSPRLFHPRQTTGLWVKQIRSVASVLISQLQDIIPEQSNYLNLTLAGPDKVRTAGVLNAWMEAFIEQAAELRGQNLSENARTLDAQRDRAARDKAVAESTLQDFRARNMTKPGESGALSGATAGGGDQQLSNQYFKTKAEYDNVQHDRQSLDSIAQEAKNGIVSPDEIMSVSAVANTPALKQLVQDLIVKQDSLRTLEQTYTAEHPQVKAIAAQVKVLRTQAIPAAAANAAAILERREHYLLQQLHSDSLNLTGIPARSIEEARLRQNLADREKVYNLIEDRSEAMRLGSVGTPPDVRIVDRALPSSMPQKNIVLILMAGGFIGSLMFGLALALLLDIADPRFRYPEQITHELKLDVLGAVPAVPKPGDTHSNPDAMLQSVEAFRSLRMNLHHEFSAPPVLLTITSPGAGDGKSMVASNLALSFSEAGYRTLLIDGDIRRGKLHAVFDLDRRPGLLDYLAGDVEANAIFREVPMHGNLTLIPGGTRRHRGPELLTSARLPALLDLVRSRFDVILVDSAPLAAGVDAYALGVATGSMVLIMRTGVTDRRVAKAKLKLVERLPIRLLGAVVNAVPAAGLYTEYSYLYGYSPDADPEDQLGEEIAALKPAPESNG